MERLVSTAGARRRCDFNQQQGTYEGSRLEGGEVSVAAWIYLFFLVKISFPPCTCYHANIQASRLY